MAQGSNHNRPGHQFLFARPPGSRALRGSAAFTLIELLVVVAIISLLISILIPSLRKAKDLAMSTICMTNLRTVGFQIVLYAEDSDGALPWYQYPLGVETLWWYRVGHHSGMGEAWICPTDPAPYSTTTWMGTTSAMTYNANKYLGWQKEGIWIYPEADLLDVDHPDRKPVIFDSISDDITQGKEGFGWYSISHFGTTGNVWCLDGHVTSVEPSPYFHDFMYDRFDWRLDRYP